MNYSKDQKTFIVIVGWNAKAYLTNCLASVFQQSFSNFEVIFIDNGSTDGSVELVRSIFPHVRTICLEINYGFAKANNIGIELALEERARYIVFLNVDTVVHENFLEELIIAADSDENIGVCQPKLYCMDDTTIIDAVGITLKKNGKTLQLGSGKRDSGIYDQPKEIFGANAAAALYKSETLKQIGLFEEECFAYYEDVDLALRSRLAGWKCIYVPHSVAYHKHSITYGDKSLRKEYLITRNRYYYYIKNLPLYMVSEFLIRKTINILGLLLQMPLRLSLFDKKGFHRNTTLLKAHYEAIMNIPKMFRKRKEIQSKKVTSNRDLLRWFV